MYAVIPGKAKPSKSVSTDQTRLQHAELRETSDGWELIACDRYQIARVKLEVTDDNDGEPLTSGPISPDALKAIEKSRGFRANGSTVTPCDKHGVVAGPSYPRPDVGTFPDWDQFTPEPPAEEDAYIIGLDAKLLHALSQSINTDGNTHSHVFLRVDLKPFKDGASSQRKPIMVGRNSAEFPGLLMPVAVKS